MSFTTVPVSHKQQEYNDMFETITHDKGLEARLRGMFIAWHEEQEDAEDRKKVQEAMQHVGKGAISFSDYKKEHGL